MTGRLRLGSADALAMATLLATSIVIALPIFRGGYLTYVDNSVHLAEIFELAQNGGNGWSELSFTGFALGTLHSRLWYGGLALLARFGAPVERLYTALLVIGFAFPALCIYAVARRRMSAWPAGVVSYLVLVQAPMITGIGSPLAGMWTHALAVGFVVLLADLYSRSDLDWRGHLAATILLALVALTHLFALVVTLWMIALVTLFRGKDAALSRSEVRKRAIGWMIAAAISADYWLAFLMTTRSNAAPMDMLDPVGLACRLLLPCDVMYLLDERLDAAVRSDLYLTDAAPMVGLLVIGIIGAVIRRKKNDVLGRVGFWLGCIILAALLVHRYYTIPLLGPVSWRLLLWVPLGFALSSLTWLAGFRKTPSRIPSLGIAAAATALGAWWGAPLRHDMPKDFDREVAEYRRLSQWFASHKDPEWGRVYLQDTFGQRWQEAGLSHSHLLVLIAREAELPQLGTYYGVVPYRTRWTLSEFNALFGQWHPTGDAVVEGMEKTNAGVLVTSNAHSAQWIAQTQKFEQLYRVGRYAVFRRTVGKEGYVDGLRPSNHIGAVSFRTGDIAFDVRTEYPRGRVLVKTTFHPWWRLSGIPKADLLESPEGFLVVDRIPVGSFRAQLSYRPNPFPTVVSWFGVALLVVWTGISIRKNRERSATLVAKADEGG